MMEKELQLSKLSHWLGTEKGDYYLTHEQEVLDSFLSLINGYYLVQLGLLDAYDLKSASPMMQRVYVGRGEVANIHEQTIEAKFNDLPFQYESVDCFFLPHTLEYVTEPTKLLHDLYNILIPGGKLIIFGFNPFSLFGLTKLVKSAKNVPWGGKFISLGHVNFWLRAAGFSIDDQKCFAYTKRKKPEQESLKVSYFGQIGRACFPYSGSIYCVMAQKQAPAVTSLKHKVFSKKLPVSAGFPEPSTNKGL